VSCKNSRCPDISLLITVILSLLRPRSLRSRKNSYYESTTAAHFSVLFRYVEPLCASKERKTGLAVALSRYGYFYRADSEAKLLQKQRLPNIEIAQGKHIEIATGLSHDSATVAAPNRVPSL